MIQASIAFFALAIVAYIFGAYGLAGISVEAGRILLGVFLVIALVSFFASFFSKGLRNKH